MKKRHLFIVNPIAGKKDSGLVLVPKLLHFIKERDIDGKVELTTAPQDAKIIARRYMQDQSPLRIISCGGDGTLNEVVDAAKHHEQVEVCQLPCGSGNDFVKSIGAEQDFFNLARNIIDGVSIPVDLISMKYSANGETGERVGIAICSVGIDAEIASNIPKYRRMKLFGGKMAYNVSILERLTRPLAQEFVIETGEERFEGRFLLATVANSCYYGGGFCAAPNAVFNDGILEVCMVREVSLARFIKVIGQYKRGEHFKGKTIAPHLRDIIEARSVKNINISSPKPFVLNLDGECMSVDKINIEILHKAVNFVVPAGISL